MGVKGDDIAERMLNYSVGVLKMASKLPRNEIWRQITLQATRSAASVGANYEEARGAESRADFVHKVGVSRKELRESLYWMKMIKKAGMSKGNEIDALCKEAGELIAILVKSMKTASKKMKKRIMNPKP